MKFGFVGLGKMGENMVLNLLEKKHKVVVNDVNQKQIKKLVKKGAIPGMTVKEMMAKLPKRKIVWIMVPAGEPVDIVIAHVAQYMKRGDIIIDGGNSYYKDSIYRYNHWKKKKGIKFLDCGTSGGMGGARHGACMMVGGDKPVFKKVEKLFKDMCVSKGYGYMGKSGAGHFVKMVHNGIEYGMMGAIGEGFEAIQKHSKKFGTDIKEVSKVYSHGSIISGSLMGWLDDAFLKKGYLESISCEVPKGATEDEMKHLEKIATMPVLKTARLMRVRSRKKPSLRARIIAALRNQFGGHAVIKN